MLKACVKTVDYIWKALGQAGRFCTASTIAHFGRLAYGDFYTYQHTVFAHIYVSSTQLESANFNLLARNLYSVSTIPNMTTNLIKE